MNKLGIITTLLLIILSSKGFSQEEISGVTPSKTIEVSNQKLKFNGAGLREKYFLDLYVGSLYLSTLNSDAGVIINADESMAIVLDIVSGLITSEKMVTAIDDGFKNSTEGKSSSLQTEIESFKEAFKLEIVEGDHFVIAYLKDQGTVIQKNGKVIKTIEGLKFKKALFGIWLCNKPADQSLKEGMLGLD